MNINRQNIEKNWVENFINGPLITDENLNIDLVKKIFNGGSLPDKLSQYSRGFRHFSNCCNDSIEFKSDLLSFLSLLGIELKLENLSHAILNNKVELRELVRKIIMIFRTLSSTKSKFNIYDPYCKNFGEINTLLNIETKNFGSKSDILDSQTKTYNEYIKLPKDFVCDEFTNDLYSKIENSNKSFFITGKAGTGKSTFIHYFTKNTKKEILLLSSTGIAAVNIGGQTIHSFFAFPHRPMTINDKEIKSFKFINRSKYNILKNVDTIIIDEVSMLRSDLLEGINRSLILNGGDLNLPFGGKQILLVGDPFQLPPVVESNKLNEMLFSSMYSSQYFFDSPSYKKLNPEKVELKTIHRQKDLEFISLLNKVRDYSVSKTELEKINSRCIVQDIENNDLEIKLTTNRFLSNKENIRRLDLLKNEEFVFKADIRGDFPTQNRPAPETLKLKRDAQIMFVKNDTESGMRKWVNGTITKINFISEDGIEVKLKSGELCIINKEEWENKKYKWDKKTKSIISETIGTFRQYPIKLAWAITIHKSQGLTFDKLRVNLGNGTFAPGQLYTSLSRCKSFNGLSLDRPVKISDVIIDERVKKFQELTV